MHAMGVSSAPAKLRILHGRGNGTDSGGRPVAPPPTFRRVAPKPPTWMTPEAKAEWRRVVPELTRLDLLKAEDRAVLTHYCETWATYVIALRAVRRDGITVTNSALRKDGVTSTWTTKNPAVAVMERAGADLVKTAREFGLTPSSESSVGFQDGIRDDGPPDQNPFA